MKVKQITLDDDRNPDTITVEMTMREAAFILKDIGRHSEKTAKEVMRDGDESLENIYLTLSGDVFNRYWDGGVRDVE